MAHIQHKRRAPLLSRGCCLLRDVLEHALSEALTSPTEWTHNSTSGAGAPMGRRAGALARKPLSV
eukprot:3273656-Prymnesium_polylepis.2